MRLQTIPDVNDTTSQNNIIENKYDLNKNCNRPKRKQASLIAEQHHICFCLIRIKKIYVEQFYFVFKLFVSNSISSLNMILVIYLWGHCEKLKGLAVKTFYLKALYVGPIIIIIIIFFVTLKTIV